MGVSVLPLKLLMVQKPAVVQDISRNQRKAMLDVSKTCCKCMYGPAFPGTPRAMVMGLYSTPPFCGVGGGGTRTHIYNIYIIQEISYSNTL